MNSPLPEILAKAAEHTRQWQEMRKTCEQCLHSNREDSALYCRRYMLRQYCIDMRDEGGACGPQAIQFVRRSAP